MWKKNLKWNNNALGNTAQLIHSLTKKLKQNNNTEGNAAQLIHSVKKQYNDKCRMQCSTLLKSEEPSRLTEK